MSKTIVVLALALALGCRPETSATATPHNAATPTPAPTTAPPTPSPTPATAGFRMVIDEVLPGESPMVIGHIVQGDVEVGDELELVGAQPPLRVRIAARERFRRPGGDATRDDVGLMLELPPGVGAEALVPGATLQAVAPQ